MKTEAFSSGLMRRAIHRVLAALLTFGLPGTMSAAWHQAGRAVPVPWPVFEIPHLAGVAIDGDAADWRGGGFRVDVLVPEKGPMPNREDCGAALRLGWNEAGLLVMLEVTGREWSESDISDKLWKRDSVELYLAPYVGATDQCQWLVTPGMDPAFSEPRTYLHDHRNSAEIKKLPAEIIVGRMKTGAGYRMEALLPWGSLGITPKLGLETAFQVIVNSHARNGLPQDRLVWFPMPGAFQDNRKMHRLRLASRPSPPVAARARVRIYRRESRTECEVVAPPDLAGRPVSLRSGWWRKIAAGRLSVDTNGYVCARLSGRLTDADIVYLDVDGRVADYVLLRLPEETSVARKSQIETRVRVGLFGAKIILDLPDAPMPGYRIGRRLPGEAWETLATGVGGGAFRDTTAVRGRVYEYAVLREGKSPAADYFWAGSNVPLRDQRGTILLMVERSQADPLAAEIRRLMLDLVGDGWDVRRHDVAATQSPPEIRRIIRAEYDRAPDAVKAVMLLGHVPVPHAGDFAPDGHDDHVGAWPADVYYGALEGEWTDESVNHAVEGRQRNVPGDGRFDQSEIPGRVQLAVGRVDFHGMPAFPAGETELLRSYLDRDHAYRQGSMRVAGRGLVQDGFDGHSERFAYSGWQNFVTLLGSENVRTATWPNIRPGMTLWFYGCGGGGHENMGGFGSTDDLVAMPLESVFTMLFGSYFGDWAATNNLMRAALAGKGGALTCGWGGRPHWYVHSMGMGETIGDGLLRTQNNSGSDYLPTGSYPRGVHIALLGDPTLRLHCVAPPSELQARLTAGGVLLRWKAPARGVLGYHVYRANAEFGPYERLTATSLDGCRFLDPAGTPGHHYQVRSVVLQKTNTGTYYNSSQGVFVKPMPVETAPASQARRRI